MQVLFEKRFLLDASREHVWELLTSLEQRKTWQKPLESARCLYGTEGAKGARIELTLVNQDNVVIEHIKRSDEMVRLITDYKLGEKRYRQVFSISRVSEYRTSLTYVCQQEVPSGWFKIFKKDPPTPTFLDPLHLENLQQQLLLEAKAAVPANWRAA